MSAISNARAPAHAAASGRRSCARGFARRRPRGVAPEPIAERDEVGAGSHQRRHLLDRAGITDARQFEHLRPPGDALLDRGEGWPRTGRVGLAEHDVIGAGLGRDHGVVAGRKPAGAGDALRFEARQRVIEAPRPR